MNKKDIAKIFKRFFITFLICLPIFILIGVFLTDKIGNVWTVVLFILIGAIAFVLEEIWHKAYQKKQEQKRENARNNRRTRYIENKDEKMSKD